MKLRHTLAFAAVALAVLSTGAAAAPCAGFSDVDDTSPFCASVTYMKTHGITLGCTSTAYCPSDAVSRIAMAAFMARLAKQAAPGGIAWQPFLVPRPMDVGPVAGSTARFYRGFTDGTFGYLVPYGSAGAYTADVVRFRLDDMSTAAGSTTVLNLQATDPLAGGFTGGFTDGRYGYLVPLWNLAALPGKSGRVQRIDLANFASGGVTALDVATVNPALAGFGGGVTDGRYGYLLPYFNNSGPSGVVGRVDLRNFASGGVASLDLASVDASLVGGGPGFVAGGYVYMAVNGYNPPTVGKFVRVAIGNFTPGGVTVLDLAASAPGLSGFSAALSDGRYGYLVPYNNGTSQGKLVRIDLATFTVAGVLDLAAIDPDLVGFGGGFTDGHYLHLAPYENRKAARVDLSTFAASDVEVMDLAQLDGAAHSYYGAFTNGKYGVFVPHPTSGTASKVLRFQLFQGPGH